MECCEERKERERVSMGEQAEKVKQTKSDVKLPALPLIDIPRACRLCSPLGSRALAIILRPLTELKRKVEEEGERVEFP
jgi:hypothetical protein